jgi:hypothetical protein
MPRDSAPRTEEPTCGHGWVQPHGLDLLALVLAGEDVVRAEEAGGVRTGPYEVIEPAPAGVPDELRLRDVSEGLPQALAIPVKEAFLGIGTSSRGGP